MTTPPDDDFLNPETPLDASSPPSIEVEFGLEPTIVVETPEERNLRLDRFLATFEAQYVPEYRYRFEYMPFMKYAYMTDTGIILLSLKNRPGESGASVIRVYTWSHFEILSFYYEKDKGKKTPIKHFAFKLNDMIWHDETWSVMIKRVQEFSLDTPSLKNLFLNLLTQYIENENIRELEISDVIGYTDGWHLPGDYHFVSGNEFRAEIEQNIYNMYHLELTDEDRNALKDQVKKLYELTSIAHKGVIFAYGFVAPFLFALRKVNRLLPLLAIGGSGGKGKTIIEEFFSVKMWGNTEWVIGSALMDSVPRVQGIFTSSTLPVAVDDCQDLKDFVTNIFKRYTAGTERVKKLNPDQSTKMDCEYCSPAMLTFNALPILFNSVEFRQRCILIYDGSESVNKENDEWLKIYNSIQRGHIGRYIIEQTRDMRFEDLVHLYNNQSSACPGHEDEKNRQKTIIRLINLGKHFAKKWFDIDIDISGLYEVLLDTMTAGNEEITDLIKNQVDETAQFVERDGHLINTNNRSWVIYPVLSYAKGRGENAIPGYIYTNENALDLARRLSRKPTELSLKNLTRILETEWKSITLGVYYFGGGNRRGIFIPQTEIDLTRRAQAEAERREREFANMTPEEREAYMHDEFENPDDCEPLLEETILDKAYVEEGHEEDLDHGGE